MAHIRHIAPAFVACGLLIAACGDEGGSAATTEISSTISSNTTTESVSTTASITTTKPSSTAAIENSSTTTSNASASPPGPADVAALAPNIGCGDAAFTFATPDDDLLMRVNIPGLLAIANATDGAVDLTFDLGDPASGATATLESGTGLGTSACNDVPATGYEVAETWLADAGTASLTIATVPDGPLEVCLTRLDASLAVDEVSFVVGGESVTAPTLTLDSAVGWCPG